MKILIYRSVEEQIRVNSAFTENLVESLSEKYDIEITMENDISINLDKIETADLIIIFSHGDPDNLYHIYNEYYTKSFINRDNIDILSNKKVITFACFTGLELGEMAIKSGCEVYLGFKSKIYREFKDSNDNKDFYEKYGIEPSKFISEIYSSAFYKSLCIGIENNFSFSKFQQFLKFTIKKTLKEKLDISKNFLYHLQCQESVHRTADSVEVKGQKESMILSEVHSI